MEKIMKSGSKTCGVYPALGASVLAIGLAACDQMRADSLQAYLTSAEKVSADQMRAQAALGYAQAVSAADQMRALALQTYQAAATAADSPA